MLIFGYTYGEAGILGVPRRTDLGSASYVNAEAVPYLNGAVIGGVLLLISSSLLFVNILGTLFLSKEPVSGEAPIDTHVESKSPMILERWGFWLIVVLVLVVLAWGPVFLETVNFISGFNVQGFKPEAPIPLP